MEAFKSFESKLYTVNDQSFSDIALQVFRFQAVHNPVYKKYLQYLSVHPNAVTSIHDIPFLPISFFKTHLLQSGPWQPALTFTSSGTTGMTVSRHAVANPELYHRNARSCFESFFGPLIDYHFLALLPSYLERTGSSLIDMMDFFINESQSPHSGYYLYEVDKLLHDIEKLRLDSRKIILWGVSFALLDLAEAHALDLSHCIVFETGGMKGRRREITRGELHRILKERLNIKHIYSEYGMTELLSQAYTRGDFIFYPPASMRVVGREITDPFSKGLIGETAALNVVDLANFQTISFIETEDLGKVYSDGSFEVLGRMDNSDVRGCNLMVV